MIDRQLWGWSESNPKLPPTDRLNRAIAAYKAKYDTFPVFCLVHPATIGALEGQQVGCAVYGTPGLSRNEYLFGSPGEVL